MKPLWILCAVMLVGCGGEETPPEDRWKSEVVNVLVEKDPIVYKSISYENCVPLPDFENELIIFKRNRFCFDEPTWSDLEPSASSPISGDGDPLLSETPKPVCTYGSVTMEGGTMYWTVCPEGIKPRLKW